MVESSHSQDSPKLCPSGSDPPVLLCDSPASVRCKQCGPLSYYCLECFEQVHSSINFLHAAESWIVSGIIMLVQDLWGSKS